MKSQTVLSLICLSLFKICICDNSDSDIVTSPNGTIFYYAYGSNLLTKRLHVNNPSAVFYSIAKLKNYIHRQISNAPWFIRNSEVHKYLSMPTVKDEIKTFAGKYKTGLDNGSLIVLDFNIFDEAWQGAVATIVEDDEAEVWGTVWTISSEMLHHLDQQENVSDGWYFAKNVTLTTPSGQQLVARTYEEVINPKNKTASSDIPIERRPSNTYLEVIALGAIESRLPSEYIGFIFSFPTNGKMALKAKRDQLGYPF